MVAANLLRECEAMEAEIAMLKNKRSAAEVRLIHHHHRILKTTLTLLGSTAHHYRRVPCAARRAAQQDGSDRTQDGGSDGEDLGDQIEHQEAQGHVREARGTEEGDEQGAGGSRAQGNEG